MSRLLTIFVLVTVAIGASPALILASEPKTEWYWWVLKFITEMGSNWAIW